MRIKNKIKVQKYKPACSPRGEAGRQGRGTKVQSKKLGKTKKIVLILPLILLILTPLAYELAYWQRIFPGVSIAQVPVGNKTKKEAQKEVEKTIAQKKPQKLTLSWDAQSWEIDLEELKLTYQTTKTVNKAYVFGRNQNPIDNLKGRHQAWSKGKNFELDYTLDKTLLEEKIATLSSQIYIPVIPPSLGQKVDSIIVEPGKGGQELEEKKLFGQIDLQLANLVSTPIYLPIKKMAFKVDRQTLEKAKKRASALLDKTMILQGPKQTFKIKNKEFLPFISFQNNFNEEKIKNYVDQLSSSINQSPQNALFKFENGRVTAFRPSEKGALIDKSKTLQLIKEGLEELEESQVSEKIIELPIQLIEPVIKIGDINRFGIVEKIGEGHSNFRGSISSRIHNIQLASAKLSGILVPPGETFSLNQSLGDVSESTGFKQAYIIKEGRTILGDGGGVCQVSTTLFRAVLRAGLPIVERHPHAYRVSYYEQNYQPGFDATVFDPTVDLKFKNDTPAYILIQTSINTKSKTLFFEIYGTYDNRLVSISKARIWDQVAPPPDLYQDDPTLPTGTIKQIDWKAWGAKVAFDWKVTRNGGVLQERTFYSHYRPWQAIYLRGTMP